VKDIASFRFHIVACRDVGGSEREHPCKENGRRGILYIQGEKKLVRRVLQGREGATQTTLLTEFGRKTPWYIFSSIAIQMTISLKKIKFAEMRWMAQARDIVLPNTYHLMQPILSGNG
jgi:hypothetical protein